MKKQNTSSTQFPQQTNRRLWLFVATCMVIAVFVGAWLRVGGDRHISIEHKPAPSTADPMRYGAKSSSGSGNAISPDDIAKKKQFGANDRQPIAFRSKAVEPGPEFTVLTTGAQSVSERVDQLRGMRGNVLSDSERDAAMAFFSGKNIPEGMTNSSMHWLADELLTVMRLQEPPQSDLAERLAEVAFLPDTDPVVRDYIMQHLGHWWEQTGPSEVIDQALWRAVTTSDPTTPGSALIALSRGYERDQQEQGRAKVRQQAYELAENPNTILAVRVTALAIAGEQGGGEVKQLATDLVSNEQTPLILRKVAEQVLR